FPPLTPPVGADEDAEFRMPAVRDVCGVLEVVPAVLAPLIAARSAAQHRVRGEVTKLHRARFVDLLRFGQGDRVAGHCQLPSVRRPSQWSNRVVASRAPSPGTSARMLNRAPKYRASGSATTRR